MQGTSNFTSFEAKQLTNSYGANNAPVYFDNGVPHILTKIGSNNQPVYVNSNGIITPLTYTANRLYYSQSAEGDNPSTAFIPTSHYASNNSVAINSISAPETNFYVNGNMRVSLGTASAINNKSFVLGNNLGIHLSFGNDGLQAYANPNSVSTLLINPYGGTIQIGSSTNVTAGNYYGRQAFKTAQGFVYEGIQTVSDDSNHPLWMADTNNGTPAYSNYISYNPYVGFLTINNSEAENGGIRSTSGKLTIQSAENLIMSYGNGQNTVFSMGTSEVLRLNSSGKVVINGNSEIVGQTSASLYVVGNTITTGTTMTNNLTITSQTNENHLVFSNIGNNCIIVPFNEEGVNLILGISPATPSYIWNATSYSPATDNALSLGNLTHKWQALYLATNNEGHDSALKFVNNQIIYSYIDSTMTELNLVGAQSIKLYPNINDDTIGIIINSTSIMPITTNTMTLGTDGNRWAQLFIGAQNTYGSNTNPIYWYNGLPYAITYTTNRLYYSASENSFEASKHYTDENTIALGWYKDHTTNYDQNYFLYVNGTSYFNGSSMIAGNILPAFDERYNLGARGGNRFAHLFIGNDDSYGAINHPIYWKDGVPSPLTDTIGSLVQPVYLLEGEITAINYVTNRLYYSASTNQFTSTNHYSSDSKVAINWYAEPDAAAYNLDENFYVNGDSYHNGNDTHAGNITPSTNNTYSFGNITNRWANGFFYNTINIGTSAYVNQNSAAPGTWIEAGLIKLRTEGASIIDMNCNLSAAEYNTRLLADAIGRLHIMYSANPTLTYNNRTVEINLYNEGSLYSSGNIETSNQVRINTNTTNKGFYLDVSTIPQASLYIQSIGTETVSGNTILTLGNSLTNIAGQSRGHIYLYADNDSYTDIQAQGNGNRTFYLPNYNNVMYATHVGSNNAVGTNSASNTTNTAQPVYVATNGRITAITNAIATTYGGTGNNTFTQDRLVYSEANNKLSSTTITSNGTYLGNVSYLDINQAHPASPTYRLVVNGNSNFKDNITIDSGKTINFANTKQQYIQWNNSTDAIDNVGSWYGICQANNKIYIAHASGIELCTNNGPINLSSLGAQGTISIKTNNSNILLQGTLSNVVASNNIITSFMLDTSNKQVKFITGGQENSISLLNNGNVIPNTGNTDGTVGTLTKGVYSNAGVITAMTYYLKADVNEIEVDNTSNLLAYYSGKNAISPGTITTDGTSYIRGIGNYTNGSYALETNTFICNDWIRTVGDTGWLSETYGGGWYMIDEDWIRNYTKDIFISKGTTLRAQYKIEIGNEDATANDLKFYVTNVGDGYFSNKLGIGAIDSTNTYKLYVNGKTYLNGNLDFAPTGDTGTSSGINWTGSTDSASIYYKVATAGQGILCINASDVSGETNKNSKISFQNNGSEKLYIDNNGVRPVSQKLTFLQGLSNAPINMTDINTTNYYYPWICVKNTSNTKYFSMGVKGTEFYWIGSATSRTSGNYDHGMSLDIHSGKLTVESLDSGSISGTSITATYNFYGSLIGNVTGNVTGNVSGNCGGNANSASSIAITSNSGVNYLVGVSTTTGNQAGHIYSPVYMKGGSITADRVYNAVWNDIAECRLTADIQVGQVVVETPSGMMIPSTERLQASARITSDTYGYCMGHPEDDGTPIAIAGRVLAYPYRDKSEYKLGAAVCAAPGGTVDIMTRDEIMMYPDRIIGTVSEIPNYETWDGHYKKKDNNREPTEIKGRIWIYVR